jgi:hypothetical protein
MTRRCSGNRNQQCSKSGSTHLFTPSVRARDGVTKHSPLPVEQPAADAGHHFLNTSSGTLFAPEVVLRSI